MGIWTAIQIVLIYFFFWLATNQKKHLSFRYNHSIIFMKKLIQSLTVLSLSLMLVGIQSCRKPKPNNDPCRNPIQVTALSNDANAYAHFSGPEGHLFAVNFSHYANQIMEGNEYQISYVEVACKDKYDRCGSIAVGGCFPQKKCIQITCLKPIAMNCLGCELNPKGYNEIYNCLMNVYQIQGRSLKTRVGFSGCSEANSSNLKLYLQMLPNAGPSNQHIWVAKVAYPDNSAYICQAYFEKDLCFDLTAINNYYMLLNMIPPKDVTIRFVKDKESFDFTYPL